MNSLQIESALKTLRVNTKVYAANRLPRTLSTPCAIVINTDPDTKPGSHWIAIFIDKFKNGEFFDSYGFPPQVEFHKQFLNSACRKWTHNPMSLQSYNTTVCGQYCLVFLYFKARGKSLSDFLKKFSSDSHRNDKIVTQIYYRLFKSVNLKKSCNCSKPQGCGQRRF